MKHSSHLFISPIPIISHNNLVSLNSSSICSSPSRLQNASYPPLKMPPILASFSIQFWPACIIITCVHACSGYLQINFFYHHILYTQKTKIHAIEYDCAFVSAILSQTVRLTRTHTRPQHEPTTSQLFIGSISFAKMTNDKWQNIGHEY